MRCGFVFSGLFWGVLLIIMGLLSILRTVFNINIPLFRMGVALFIIYIGISMLINDFGFRTDKNMALFEEKRFEVSDDYQEYNTIFGRGEVYLSNPDLLKERSKIDINTVFGSTIVMINPEFP